MGAYASTSLTVTPLRTDADPARLILEVLRENRGVMVHAAHALHVDRKTLRRHIHRLGLWPAVNRLRREVVAARERERR